MCGSGVLIGILIGMELTVHLRRRTLQGLRMGRTVLAAEVAGSTLPGIVGHPAVTAARLVTATATWGSAWLSRNYNVRQKGNQKPCAEKAKSKEAAEQASGFGFYFAGRKRKFLSQSTNIDVRERPK